MGDACVFAPTRNRTEVCDLRDRRPATDRSERELARVIRAEFLSLLFVLPFSENHRGATAGCFRAGRERIELSGTSFGGSSASNARPMTGASFYS